MIDQVGFPLIRSEARYGPLISCDAFAARGDYTNLQWMADKIQHGHAINWDRATSQWQTQYITSPKPFDHLLSVCPDPGKCLSAVAPQNLCMLINSASTTSLAEKIVRFFPSRGGVLPEDIVEDSPFFMAAWQMLRNQPPCGPAAHSTAGGSGGVERYTAGVLTESGVDLSMVLNWASRFALHLLDVEDDRKGRSEFLGSLLCQTARGCLCDADKAETAGDEVKARRCRQMAVEVWSI